jgi:hypothetical protein
MTSEVPRRVVVFTSDHLTEEKKTLKELVGTFANGVWSDIKTTNKATAGKAIKFGSGAVVVGGDAFAKYYEVLTPFQWAMRGFGPLPAGVHQKRSYSSFRIHDCRAGVGSCRRCCDQVRSSDYSLRRRCCHWLRDQSNPPRESAKRYWGNDQ